MVVVGVLELRIVYSVAKRHCSNIHLFLVADTVSHASKTIHPASDSLCFSPSSSIQSNARPASTVAKSADSFQSVLT